MAKGTVVLVPFPFDDLSATKVRPAVCLSDPVVPTGMWFWPSSAAESQPSFLKAIWCWIGEARTLSVPVSRPVPCSGFIWLITVSESLIRRELGRLSSALQQEMDDRLRRLFGL
jgi:mRNA interferase MazF